MVEQVVRLTLSLTVNDGQVEAFKAIAKDMTAGSQAETGTLGYEWFAGNDGSCFRLVETYVDAKAVEAHFKGPVVQQLVPGFWPPVRSTAWSSTAIRDRRCRRWQPDSGRSLSCIGLA